jgi:hypothetical protein
MLPGFWDVMSYELVIRGTRPEEGNSKVRELLTPIYQTVRCHITDHELNTEIKPLHSSLSQSVPERTGTGLLIHQNNDHKNTRLKKSLIRSIQS